MKKSNIKNQISKIVHWKREYKRAVFLPVFVLVVLLACTGECFAEANASSELIGWAKHYDGKTVIFEGEVIGDIMVRGSHAWVNLNDGRNGIGVWIDARLLNGRLRTGSYTSKGSWVSVTGTFSRACPEHGGDLDIHARSLEVVRDGHTMPETIDLYKSGLALAAMLTAGATWLVMFLWKARKVKTG